MSTLNPLLYYMLKVRSTADPNGNPAEFEIPFKNQLNLEVRDHFEVGLMKGHIPLTWNTISPELDNDEISIGGSTLTIPPGHHTLYTLQQYLNGTAVTLERVHYKGRIRLTTTAEVIFPPTRNLGDVLGFPPGTYAIGTHDAPNLPDFTGGVKEINIETDLVNANYIRNNGQQSNALIRVTPPDAQPYTTFQIVNTDVFYVPMSNTTSIAGVRIQVTDQNRQAIKFQDHSLASDFCVCIRKVSRDAPALVPTAPQ